MNQRELVVVAIAGALLLRAISDVGHGGTSTARGSSRAYLAILLGGAVAAFAVDVAPPIGVAAAGLLVATVALHTTDRTAQKGLIGRVLAAPAPAAATDPARGGGGGGGGSGGW